MFALLARSVTRPAVPVVRWLARRHVERLADAKAIQERVLLEKLAAQAVSDFGRRHDFAKLRSVADFRSAVPLGGHATFKPWLDRVLAGEPAALFGPDTKLLGFTLSSGTTGRRKVMPITAVGARELCASWHLWGEFMYTDHPEVIGSPLAQLASDWGGERSATGLPMGDISGLLARLQPWFTRWAYCVPYAASEITDDALRYQAYLRLAVAEPRVRFVATATPATLVRLAELANAGADILIKDLADGTLFGKPVSAARLPPPVAAALSQRRPARARDLAQRAMAAGGLCPRVYWSNLALVATWIGGTFGHYREPLRRWYGDVALRDVGLMASEGHFTIPTADDTVSALPNLESHFFEFVPTSGVAHHVSGVQGAEPSGRAEADKHPLLPHELTIGATYSLVVTTSNGLYRYDLEDLVRCTSFSGTTPLLEFLAKAAHVSDLTGEKLSAHHVAEALRLAQHRLGLPLPPIILRARHGFPPYYEMIHEPGGPAGPALANACDEALAEVNYIYKEHRRSGKLAPLRDVLVPTGTLDAGREHAEQAKPRLLLGLSSEAFPGLPA